jgi:hypothetical protein
MDRIFLEIGYVFLLLIPSVAVVLQIVRERRRDRKRAVAPFDGLRRRPAGESIRLHLLTLDEKIDEWLMLLVLVPFVSALVLAFQPKQSLILSFFFFLGCAALAFVAYRKLQPLLTDRGNFRLGFDGERYVAEELNELRADGYQIYHDLPFEGFNIDHVIVGPAGIFSIETKTRRKPLWDGGKEYKVEFDGNALNFPHCRDTFGVEQARRNAETLSKWLTKATGQRVIAQPVVVLPGWWVTCTGRSDVQVLSGKNLRKFFVGYVDAGISDALIQAISYQIEEKSHVAV